MARKLSILSVFITVSVIVLLSGWETYAQQRPAHTFNRNTISGLNSVLALQPQPEGGQQLTLAAGDTVQFTMNVNAQTPPPNILSAPYIAVSPETMTGTAAALQYNLYVNKTGQGLWRLDQITATDANGNLIYDTNGNPIYLANQNNLWATADNQFTVNQGTLELMQGSSITLQGTAANTRFILGANTTLNARGPWGWSTIDANGNPAGPRADNFINAANIQIRNGVTLGFDLTNYTAGQPILNLQGNVTSQTPATDNGKLNLLGFNSLGTQTVDGVTLQLLQYNYTGTAPAANTLQPGDPTYAMPPIRAYYTSSSTGLSVNANPVPTGSLIYEGNFELLVRGQRWDDVRNAGRVQGTLTQNIPAALTGGQINIQLDNFKSFIGEVSWTGNANNDRWDATSQNWTGNIVDYGYTNTFLHGDLAMFGGTTGLETITVQQGGVQIGDIITNPNYSGSNYSTLKGNVGMVVSTGTYQFSNEGGSLIGIDGPGGVVITNGASVTFDSANSYWGGTVVEMDSYLTLGNSGAIGTRGIDLKTGSVLTFATGVSPDNFHNSISTEDGTQIYKDNDNSLTIYGNVTGNADTTIHAGTLRKNIGQGVLTVFKGATYDTTDVAGEGRDRSIMGLSDRLLSDPIAEPVTPDAVVNIHNYKLYINVGAGKEYTFSGQIQGIAPTNETFLESCNIVKSGYGTQVFANVNNTYTGNTQIYEGTLVGQHIFSDTDSFTDLDGNNIQFRPFGTGTVNIEENALLQFDLQRILVDPDPHTELYVATFDNTITGDGDLEMKDDFSTETGKAGSTEILYLTANDSSYTGKTSINGGKIRIQSINSTGKTSEVAIQKDSALQFNEMADSSKTTPYDRIITGEGDVEVLKNTIVYVRSFNDDLPKDNQPVEQLKRFSSYTGNTFVEQDSGLHLLDVSATGKTNIVDLKTDTSTLYLDFASQKDEISHQEIDQVYDRYIHGDGNLVKTDKGTAVLDVAPGIISILNDYIGTTTVKDGTLKLMYAEATGTFDTYGDQSVTVEQSTDGTGILELAFDGDYDKGIKGKGILAKSEAGTITYLQGKSTYEGGTYIYSGTLSYSNLDVNTPGNLGSGGVEFKRSGGTLQNRNAVEAFTQRIVIDGGSTATFDTLQDLTIAGSNGIMHNALDPTDPYYNVNDTKSHLVKTGDATMTINTMAAWTGNTRVEKGILVNNIPIDTALTVELDTIYRTGNADRQVSAILGDGTVETAAYHDFIVNNADTDVFDGQIIGFGNLVKKNSGTLLLNGDNKYFGATQIDNGTVVGNIASGTDLTVYGNGKYQAGSFNRFLGSLQGNGTVDMQGKNLTITQNRMSFSPVFSGTIINGNQLIKNGIGSQTLGGTHYKFTDDININEGILRIGGVGTVTTHLATDQNLNVKEGAALYLDRLANIEIKKNLNIDGTLYISFDHNSIWTGSATFGDNSVLDIRGIGANDQQVLLIQSDTAVDDNFSKVLVAGEESEHDFLFIGVTKSDDKKKLYVGQALRWYSEEDKASGNFTLNSPDAEYAVYETLKDVTGKFTSGWDGKTLTKMGLGTLILGTANSYTGETQVKAGTLKLIHEQATAGSKKIVLETNLTTLNLDFDSRQENGSWSKGLLTPITGKGEVVKTGYNTISVLGGTNTYTGDTNVRQGGLLVDGSINSHVWVREDAGFGGNGFVNNTVSFENGSHYYWRFGVTEAESDTLSVTDNVYIGENVSFKPVTTVLKDHLNSFENWIVLKYGSEIYGQFAEIDASSNPFFDFNLDYDQHGVVKVSGYLRNQPRALSDIVPTSLMLAQTKMYRTAFQQITREWQSECTQHLNVPQARGQVQQSTRSAWMSFVGRGDNFESNYFKEDYSLQSYGVQAGISFISNCTQNFGFLFGREEGKLSNDSDYVKDEDYYLGFYYGQKFFDEHDIRAYIGGGWQSNDLLRTSNGYRYGSKYNGNTFNLNAEIGRRFFGRNDWSVRLLGGFDVEVRRIGGSTEKSLDLEYSNEYRQYKGSDLSRVFARAGIEANKTWRRIDFRAGTQLGWNFGDTRPKTMIYYPALEETYTRADVLGSGAHLGRLEWWLNVGMDWYLTDRRNTFFFLDYNGDVYLDRDGNTSAGTGNVGFCWRF